MTPDEKARDAFALWYSQLRLYSGFTAKGTIAGALVVLERLKSDFDLNLAFHTTRGGSQIIGASGAAVKQILARFGEQRAFVSEGGRTNRGLRGDIAAMLTAIGHASLTILPPDQRARILSDLQAMLVEKVREFHGQQRLRLVFDQSKSTWQIVKDLLELAGGVNKAGPVAQYLVGAKLALRFPGMVIGNLSFSTADQQLGRAGDFLVENTAFHVTVAPMPAVYEKCMRNLQDGLRPYLLVPDRLLVGTRQNAEQAAAGQIVVEAIETFVSQNIDELATFNEERRGLKLLELSDTYNARTDEVEMDKSMLIVLPSNLEGFR